MINFLTFTSLLLISSQITRIIGKPVKTIRTEYGAVYDCVDFYKQPAFQHPLLKNHSFHPKMRPSSIPEGITSRRSDLKNGYKSASYARLKDGGCPENTVPIRRYSKKERAQANSLSRNLINQLEPGIHRAVALTKPQPSTTTYKGVGAKFSVWKPSLDSAQYSSGRFLLQNGPDSIQVGWTVNPTVNKDNQTHVFIHTTTGNGTHCFNTLCPGFVIVTSDIPPDFLMPKTSTRGGEIVETQFFVYRDEVNGNWWLGLGKQDTTIGFWPSRIFNGLAEYGNYIECGGETYSPPGSVEEPPMGTGEHVLGRGSVQWDAFCSNFVTVNQDFKIVDVENTVEFSDSDNYDVIDIGHEIKDLGHAIFFGGPGQ